jgi:hypothetical protein
MTPEQKFITKLVCIVLLLLACFGAGFYLRDVQADRDINATKLEGANAQINAHKQFEKKIEVRDTANRKLNADYQALQITASQDLNEKLAENSRLAADLGIARGMSLRGTRCPDPAAGGSGGATGLVADSNLLLSAETRQLVFDLRASIVEERAATEGWKRHAAVLDRQIREHQLQHHEVTQ